MLRKRSERGVLLVMSNNGQADPLHEKLAAYRSSAVPTAELIDELYREEVRDPREMPPEEKLLTGQRLFEAACRITLARIENQYSELDEKSWWEMLRKRAERQRKVEQPRPSMP